MAGPARAFKEARWLSGVKPLIHNQAQIKGTVEEVGQHNHEVSTAHLRGNKCFFFSDNSHRITQNVLFILIASMYMESTHWQYTADMLQICSTCTCTSASRHHITCIPCSFATSPELGGYPKKQKMGNVNEGVSYIYSNTKKFPCNKCTHPPQRKRK